MSKFKDIKLTLRERSLLTILIAEIQECKDIDSIKAVTNSWITTNELHPEKVETLSQEEVRKFLTEK